jgi:hypothetical protein
MALVSIILTNWAAIFRCMVHFLVTMSDVVLVGSDRCGIDDLFLEYESGAAPGRLGQGPGWPGRWTGTRRIADGEVNRRDP